MKIVLINRNTKKAELINSPFTNKMTFKEKRSKFSEI